MKCFVLKYEREKEKYNRRNENNADNCKWRMAGYDYAVYRGQ